MIKYSKSRLWFVFSSILLLVSFHIAYEQVVSPWQSGAGYTYQIPTAWMFSACYILCIIPSFILPLKTQKPSQIMLTIIYLGVYIPTVFMLVFTGRLDHYTALQLNLVLCAGMFILVAFSNLKPLQLPSVRRWSFTGFLIFLVLGILFCIILLFATYGAHIEFVSFAERSEQRLLARTLTTPIVGYMMGVTLYVFAPTLMAIALIHKRYILLPFAIAPYILSYGASAARADILSVALLLGLYWIVSKSRRFAPHFIMAVFAVAMLLTVPAYRTDKAMGYELAELTARRTLANSGWQMITYNEFFSRNPYTYFAHYKIIDWVVEYPYDLSLPRLIGRYAGGTETNSNAHIWADGLAGAGMVGMLLESLALGLVLWIIDSVARPFDQRISAMMVALYAVYLSNMGLGSAFVGGGMWLLLVIFLFGPLELVEQKATARNFVPGTLTAKGLLAGD